MVRARSALVFCVAALAAASCGSLGEPYLGSFPTSSVVDAADGGAVGDDGSDGNSPGPLGTVAVDVLPPRPTDYLPSIVIVTSDGVGVVERTAASGPARFADARFVFDQSPDEPEEDTPTTTSAGTSTTQSTTTTTTTPPEVITWLQARDDLFGGLVLQSAEGEVLWFPGTGGSPRPVVVDGDFVDVGYAAGTPEALAVRAGQISRTRLIDNESMVFASLEPGEELVDLSTSGGIVAVATSDDGCGSVSFLGPDGSEIAVDLFGAQSCQQSSRPTVGAVAMSPDGEAVAFTRIEYREDGVELETVLRAVELTSGAEILSARIGASGDVISSLAFDGSTAVVLRRSSTSSEVVVADAETIEVLDLEPIGTPRSVTFARLPLADNLGA